MHMLRNISRSKGHQKMTFGPLIEYNKRNIFCKNHGLGRLVFFFFKKKKKLFVRWKQVVCSLLSKYFDSPQLAYNKNKLYKTLNYWSRDMLNLNFSEKGLGLISTLHFVYNVSRKMFLMLYSTNWSNFIVWMPLLLEIMDNICVVIICEPGCDVIKFQINLIFLIKLFCCMTKNSRQKLKHLENEKSFWSEIKSIFHHF